MKQYRNALLRKEFPFVDYIGEMTHLSLAKIDGIKIKRGDKVLLTKTGFEDSYSWSQGGHYDYTVYFAVRSTESGEFEVLRLESSGHSSTGSGERNDWDADSIGEQLFSQNIVPDYIVECTQNDTDDNGNGKVTCFWTIHKMQRFDLASYHQQKIDEAATTLKAEIALICM